MTDRELLALAAKAYGAKMSDYSDRTPDHWIAERVEGSRSWYAWDPLTDDGDALRLAVKLRLDLHYEDQPSWLGEIVEVLSQRDEAGACHCTTVALADDPGAATRRAIVSAAAEIGRAT